MGNPWRAQADRRRRRDAPVGFVGALAADRGHLAYGRSVNEMNHVSPAATAIPWLSIRIALRCLVVRSEDVGQAIQSSVLHQRCGERDALKLNGYF